MSREVRRVPPDFYWPLHQAWRGYVMPESLRLPPCPDCIHGGRESSGYSREAWAVHATFYPHMVGGPYADALAWKDKIGQAEVDHLQAEGRLRTWDPETRAWVAVPLTAAEVNEHQRAFGKHHHDAINRWILVKFRCERLGIPLRCPTCNGEGEVGTPEQRALNEAWEPTDPPAGDGWQLWETVSEGSPVTPVFPTAEDLVDHLVDVEGFRRSAAETLVAQGHSFGSFIAVGGEVLHSARDADRIADLKP